jgi:CheY-like chemotaxis protein
MGGTLVLDRSSASGSTFRVELATAADPVDPAAVLAATSEFAVPHAGPSATILYIEDNLANLSLIEQILEARPDWRLVPALQGRLGIDLAREHAPDVVLLDLHLPDIPGEEVLRPAARLVADGAHADHRHQRRRDAQDGRAPAGLGRQRVPHQAAQGPAVPAHARRHRHGRPAPPHRRRDVTVAEDALVACTLLLVDDEEANLDLLQGILEADGFSAVVRTADARHAIPLLESVRPDLVLLDLHMPYRSGFEVLADLRERTPVDEHLPVLVLTADATFRAKQQALAGGATDFVTKPFHNAEVLLRRAQPAATRLLYQEQRRARHAAELLDEVSRVLQDSLDGATAAGRLAHLIVPRLADACAVDLEDGDGGLVRAGHALAAFTDAGAGRVAAGPDADETRALFDAPEPATCWCSSPAARRSASCARALRRRAAVHAADAQLAEELARRLARAVAHARLFREARAAAERATRCWRWSPTTCAARCARCGWTPSCSTRS